MPASAAPSHRLYLIAALAALMAWPWPMLAPAEGPSEPGPESAWAAARPMLSAPVKKARRIVSVTAGGCLDELGDDEDGDGPAPRPMAELPPRPGPHAWLAPEVSAAPAADDPAYMPPRQRSRPLRC